MGKRYICTAACKHMDDLEKRLRQPMTNADCDRFLSRVLAKMEAHADKKGY